MTKVTRFVEDDHRGEVPFSSRQVIGHTYNQHHLALLMLTLITCLRGCLSASLLSGYSFLPLFQTKDTLWKEETTPRAHLQSEEFRYSSLKAQNLQELLGIFLHRFVPCPPFTDSIIYSHPYGLRYFCYTLG